MNLLEAVLVLLSILVGYLLGARVGQSRMSDGTVGNGKERGPDDIGMIPGGGWSVAVVGLAPGAMERWGADPEREPLPEWRVERLRVVAWEVVEKVAYEEWKDSSLDRILVSRQWLRAHCIDSTQRWTSEYDADGKDTDVIQFLAPDESIDDAELMRRYEVRERERRAREEASRSRGE